MGQSGQNEIQTKRPGISRAAEMLACRLRDTEISMAVEALTFESGYNIEYAIRMCRVQNCGANAVYACCYRVVSTTYLSIVAEFASIGVDNSSTEIVIRIVGMCSAMPGVMTSIVFRWVIMTR